MEYGFCHLAAAPLRTLPSDAAEMASQLLFGDIFQILEEQEKWVKIEMHFDKYVGWMDSKQFLKISEQEYKNISQWDNFVIRSSIFLYSNNKKIPILKGSCLPLVQSFTVAGQTFSIQKIGIALFPPGIEKIALSYVGSPYLWGGRSPFGIDCSGFTQQVFKINNISLHRDAEQQAEQGKVVNSLREAQKNDLLFFNNEANKITHVGIYLGSSKVIHSSGCVRIDKINEKGIFDREKKVYTHSLCLIKRIQSTSR